MSTLNRRDLDGYENWLVGLLAHSLGKPALANIAISFVEVDGQHVCRVDARRSSKPIYASTSKGDDLFFVRTGNSTREMTHREAVEYMEHHWKGRPEHQDKLATMSQSPMRSWEELMDETLDVIPDDRNQLQKLMVETYERAKVEVGYVATRFLQMISEQGGVETAHQLLASDQVSAGFSALWEAKRLDLSVEARVLKPEFEELFSIEEKEIARSRLERFGYQLSSD
jgi:hypothetical protein